MAKRIITHYDVDGICSAAIFLAKEKQESQADSIDEILFSTPRIINEKEIELRSADIVLDLPQPKEEIGFWADHHHGAKHYEPAYPYIYNSSSKSCARILYDYFSDKGISYLEDLTEAADMIDCAAFKHPGHCKDMNDPAIRLMLALGMQIAPNLDEHRRDFIKLVSDKGCWKDILDCRDYKDLAARSLQGMAKYEKAVDQYMQKKGNIVLFDTGKKRLPGVINNFRPYEIYPDCSWLLRLFQSSTSHIISISKNPFNILGNEIHLGTLAEEIASIYGATGKGHEGICRIDNLTEENKKKAVKYILKLLD